MIFDEWREANYDTIWTGRDYARATWNTAMDAKRERCASQPGELLLALVTNQEYCMQLLKSLDTAAKQENSYEYGLPLWGDAQCAQLREVIYKWACAGPNVEASGAGTASTYCRVLAALDMGDGDDPIAEIGTLMALRKKVYQVLDEHELCGDAETRIRFLLAERERLLAALRSVLTSAALTPNENLTGIAHTEQ